MPASLLEPKMDYRIRVLSDADFLKVARGNPRYANVDDDNMGFADPKKMTAYVRQTHWPELNKYLINHEFSHLLEEKGTDEDEHGVRHKKFFKSIAPIALPILGGLLGGPLLGGALSGIGGAAAGSALGAAGGGFAGQKIAGAPTGKALLGGGISGLGALAIPAIGKAIGGAGRTVSGLFGGKGAAAPSSLGTSVTPQINPTPGINPATLPRPSGIGAFNVGAGQALSSAALPPGAGALQTRFAGQLGQGAGRGVSRSFGTPAGTALSPLSGFGGPSAGPVGVGGAPQMAGFQMAQAPGAIPGVQPPGGRLGQFFGSPLGKFAGAGLSIGAGQLFGRTPQVPDLSSLENVEAFRRAGPGGFGEPGSSAISRLTERLQSPAQLSPLNPQSESLIKRGFDRERQRLVSQFKLIRPDANLAEDSGFRQSMFELDQAESDSLFQAQQGDLQRQANDIATALGIDTQTLSQLSSLAQLDISQIMLKTGVKAQTAQDIRNTFGGLGSLFAQSALGIPNINQSLAGLLGNP